MEVDFGLHNENVVLGAMLLDPLAVHDATAKLRASDFSLDAHQRIFRVMEAMARDGHAVATDTVWGALRAKGEIDAIGGVPYLSSLTDGIPRHHHLAGNIAVVLDRSLARRGMVACQNAQQRLATGIDPATEVVDELARTLTQERPQDTLHASEVIPEALKRMYEGGGERIPTGITELDLMLAGGFLTKRLVIIGAQPSAGKSSLARQIERSAIKNGFGVHTHSIEVPREDWMLYHTASLAKIPAWKLQNPRLMNVMDKDRMLNAGEQVCGWNHLIDDSGSVHVNTLIAKSRLSAMRQNIKLYIVDYLQMLSGDEKNIRLLMGQIPRALKQFAKDNDVCVVALSQMTRKGDVNARPTVQDLKESGDIEAAADIVLLPYRPKDTQTGHYTGLDELIVGKQRDGAIGAIDLFYSSDSLTFGART